MDGETLVTREAGMIEAEVAGELVGLHVDRGVCYGFNPTATRLWRLIETPQTLAALCAALAAEYDVEEARCRDDVVAVLKTLADDRLVTLNPGLDPGHQH